MPTPQMPAEKARRLIEAIEAALREGYPPPGEVVTGRSGAIRVGALSIGMSHGSAHGAYQRAAAVFREPDWTLWQRPQNKRIAALRGEVGAPPIPPIAKPPEGFVIAENSGRYDAEGNLLRQSIRTVRDAGDPFEVPDGHIVKGESALLDPDGRILARWVKTREGSGEGLVEALRETFADYAGAAQIIAAPAADDADLLTVYPMPDLHLGMYAWAAETGENYDIKIATKQAMRSAATLVEQSRPSKRAVLLGLGDYFHSNDLKSVTPGSGHPLDVDGRWPKVYAAGAQLAVALVDMAAQKHEEVEVVLLPGNHDPDAAITLTVALALFYQNNPRIIIRQEAGLVWYHRFGKVLLGATHGHTMKPERMAMMLATDCAVDWGETHHRHFFFGHYHTENAKEIAGVRVESFDSPAARDAWNQGRGYRSNRAMTAITFHAQRGEIGRHRVNLTTPPQRIRVKAGTSR